MYQTFYPSKGLKNFVAFYYVMEKNVADLSSQTPELIMPAGAPILGFHYSGNYKLDYKSRHGEIKTTLPDFYVAGQQTVSYLLKVSKKNTAIFGVVLKPKALWFYYEVDMRTLNDKVVKMESVLGEEYNTLVNNFKKIETNGERVSLMEKYFKNKVNEKKYTPSLVDTALDLIYRKRGCTNLKDLIKETGLSERTLQRQFSVQVGVSPTQYARLIRFNNLFTEIAKPERNLDISFLTTFYNFHDVSHLNKEFKKYCGEPPSDFLIDKFTLLKELIEDQPYLLQIQNTGSQLP